MATKKKPAPVTRLAIGIILLARNHKASEAELRRACAAVIGTHAKERYHLVQAIDLMEDAFEKPRPKGKK